MTVAEFTPRLRNRIAMAIQESGLHQKDVAERMGVSPQVISAWVRGNREPSPSALVDLAETTGAVWLLDLRGLAGSSDLGERRSTWTGVSAGQLRFLNAA